jgi:hypothetical protein
MREGLAMSKQPTHTITLVPWRDLGFGEKLALDMTRAMLWALEPDERMTVLISLMAAQIDSMVENEDQIDALIDVLRMQLKLTSLHHEKEDQHRV